VKCQKCGSLDNKVVESRDVADNDAINSVDIGELVMAGLPKLNEVAYVRFASVYRKFRDISSFERELSKIRESKVTKSPKKPAAK
jgi:transcriptional repressor NrdR